MTNLNEALSKLAQFRASWKDDNVIDESSGLTAADLDVIITMALALDVQGKPIADGDALPG